MRVQTALALTAQYPADWPRSNGLDRRGVALMVRLAQSPWFFLLALAGCGGEAEKPRDHDASSMAVDGDDAPSEADDERDEEARDGGSLDARARDAAARGEAGAERDGGAPRDARALP